MVIGQDFEQRMTLPQQDNAIVEHCVQFTATAAAATSPAAATTAATATIVTTATTATIPTSNF